MSEYILRPRRHNYRSGYQEPNTSNPTKYAYDDDLDTYMQLYPRTESYESGYSRTFDNFDFSIIPSNEIITDVTLVITHLLKSSSGVHGIYPVNTRVVAPDNPIDDSKCIEEFKKISDKAVELNAVETLEYSLPSSVNYINTNKSALISGNAIYGLYVAVSTGYNNDRIYDLHLKITAQKIGTNANLGSTNISKAYLGSTGLSHIYLGGNTII